MITLPHVISNSDQPDANAIQANFDALNAGLSQISNSNIDIGAGIELNKLADGNAVHEEVIQILPISASASYAVPTDFGPFPTSFADVCGRWRKRVPSGRSLYLISYEIWAEDVSSTPGIEFQLLLDGTVVGQSIPLSAASYHSRVNQSVFASPLITVPDQGIFQPQIRQDASGSGTARGLALRLTYKEELTS